MFLKTTNTKCCEVMERLELIANGNIKLCNH